MYPTYTWLAKDVAFGFNMERAAGMLQLNTPIVLFNGVKNASLDILRCEVTANAYAPGQSAIVASPPSVTAWKVTAVSGGTVGDQISFDSALPLPSQIVGLSRCAVTRSACVARHPIAVAGLHGAAGALNLLTYMQGIQAPKTAVCAPIVLNENEGFALLPNTGMAATLEAGASGPYTVTITVRDNATGVDTAFMFLGQVLSPASGLAIGAVFNGSGSGVTLSVIDVEIACSSVPMSQSSTDYVPLAAYITNAAPHVGDAGYVYDESSLIVPSDSSHPLPSGIVAVTGAMPHQSSESPWLLDREQGGFIAFPIFGAGVQHAIPSAIGRQLAPCRLKSQNILAMERKHTGLAKTQSLRALSIAPGKGFALGTGFYNSLTVQAQAGSNGAHMFSVADVEITFQVRPITARRIIGATSIRGVA